MLEIYKAMIYHARKDQQSPIQKHISALDFLEPSSGPEV